MNDRIKLSEAMGYTTCSDGLWDGGIRLNGTGPIRLLPDPEHDANDDYAVLEWMRETYDVPRGTCGSAIKGLVFVNFREALYQLQDMYVDGYKIGDYARAALKVIS